MTQQRNILCLSYKSNLFGMFAIPLFTPTLSFHVKIIVSAPPINREEEEGKQAARIKTIATTRTL